MSVEVKIQDSISKIHQGQWNSLNENNNPFISWEFFNALEKGHCLGQNTGWNPAYMTVEKDGTLSAALPLFIKTDSYGEFIFDWSWAEAYGRYGVPYYPKLTVAIPYSPISAPKLLGSLSDQKNFLFPKLLEFYQNQNLSGLHFLFTNEEEAPLLSDIELMERDSIQYHWNREQCDSFEDYLASLKKNRRKSIKKERRALKDTEIVLLKGNEINTSDIDFFYQCYLSTIEKKWSQAYLSLEFFRSFIQSKPESCSLFIAKDDQGPLASALYFHSDDTLYGRYWGCQRDIPFLHFELCIYRGIELCLSKDLKRFEAGAQGEHKRMRGFPPTLTKSYHHLKRSEFSKAIENFIEEERQALRRVFTP